MESLCICVDSRRSHLLGRLSRKRGKDPDPSPLPSVPLHRLLGAWVAGAPSPVRCICQMTGWEPTRRAWKSAELVDGIGSVCRLRHPICSKHLPRGRPELRAGQTGTFKALHFPPLLPPPCHHPSKPEDLGSGVPKVPLVGLGFEEAVAHANSRACPLVVCRRAFLRVCLSLLLMLSVCLFLSGCLPCCPLVTSPFQVAFELTAVAGK